MGRGTPASATPDRAPQLQAHLYYFPAWLGRAYADGTNLRMSYCYFPTSLFGLAARASRAGIRRRRHSSRNEKRISLIAPPIVGRAIADARSMQCSLVTDARPRLHRPVGADSSGRERAKRRPRVIARRSAYASRGSVGL